MEMRFHVFRQNDTEAVVLFHTTFWQRFELFTDTRALVTFPWYIGHLESVRMNTTILFTNYIWSYTSIYIHIGLRL